MLTHPAFARSLLVSLSLSRYDGWVVCLLWRLSTCLFAWLLKHSSLLHHLTLPCRVNMTGERGSCGHRSKNPISPALPALPCINPPPEFPCGVWLVSSLRNQWAQQAQRVFFEAMPLWRISPATAAACTNDKQHDQAPMQPGCATSWPSRALAPALTLVPPCR